jgi:CRISPR-associated endonuclease Cas1
VQASLSPVSSRRQALTSMEKQAPMAAPSNVYQPEPSRNFTTHVPRHGVLTLFGYGITARVDRGHLVLIDGIGADRRGVRLPRVEHGLRRLVVIGSDGMVSLAALRWLADQDASFVMLDRDGSVLATTGPVGSSDARLRRAQALAGQSGAALEIACELISRKLAGQEQVTRNKLLDPATAKAIAQYRTAVPEAETVDAVRQLEAQAAAVYWSAWRDLLITFPRRDLLRVPDHWRTFGTRKSPLSGSPRLAANPANAMLNYLYTVLESEARLAAGALGLDPGLGFIHVDTPARDSLASDLMEPIRPQVDSYLFDWVTCEPLRRDWFFENRDGNCRLMGSFAVRLSETAATWGRAVAPLAEWVARVLWARRPARDNGPATRLTQRHRREAKGSPPHLPQCSPRLEHLCGGCGKAISRERTHCAECAISSATKRLVRAAQAGRVAARGPESRAKRSSTQRRQTKACWDWKASSQPTWLTPGFYAERIQPLLAVASTSAIAARIGVSRWYAGLIRRGNRPHPRHWKALAELVAEASDSTRRVQK